MEVKKKFEKPQMEVVKLKPAYVCDACSNFNPCPYVGQCFTED